MRIRYVRMYFRGRHVGDCIDIFGHIPFVELMISMESHGDNRNNGAFFLLTNATGMQPSSLGNNNSDRHQRCCMHLHYMYVCCNCCYFFIRRAVMAALQLGLAFQLANTCHPSHTLILVVNARGSGILLY